MTRWYLDTEFNEDGRTIDLISIGLCSDDGQEYYAVSSEFDAGRCSDWVKQNVLPLVGDHPVSTREQIAGDIANLVLRPLRGVATTKPEFWAYFADYDWVALCQLFGRMIDLPTGMPMYCNDLKQLMHSLKITKEMLPPQQGREHNALEDARWVRSAHEYIQDHFWRR